MFNIWPHRSRKFRSVTYHTCQLHENIIVSTASILTKNYISPTGILGLTRSAFHVLDIVCWTDHCLRLSSRPPSAPVFLEMFHIPFTSTPWTCVYKLALRQRSGIHRGWANRALGPLDWDLWEHIQVLHILQCELIDLVLTVLTSVRLLFQAPALYTTDTATMDYILNHQDEFMKPTDIKIALTLLGEGMICLIVFTLSFFVLKR